MLCALYCISAFLYSQLFVCTNCFAPNFSVQSPSEISKKLKSSPGRYGKNNFDHASHYPQSIVSQTQSNNRYGSQTKSTLFMSGYMPPDNTEEPVNKRGPPFPKIGDFVRYYDLDGGRFDGQVLIGKISFIQSTRSSTGEGDNGLNRWLVEVSELDNLGDGYYAEYPSRKRRRTSLRKLEELAPVLASFVRTEDAYKVPLSRETGLPIVSFESYNLLGYEGPSAVKINQEVLESDAAKYTDLKFTLIRDAALVGLFGAVVTDLVKGTEDAAIYAAGAAAGVGYLFFLSLKTDTVGSASDKFGKNVSNFRFLLPVIVLIGVAVKNVTSGGFESTSVFRTVTPEQFASAIIGFLTYRIPLFLRQLQPVVSESAGQILPGSAGIALQMASEARNNGENQGLSGLVRQDDLVPILVVSGPPGTGKTTLVNRLIEEGNGRFVTPNFMDRITNGVEFERAASRGEFLEVDSTGRYGLTSESIMNSVVPSVSSSEDVPQSREQVVVVDANVNLAKKLTTLAGARLIGVWVGLDNLDELEERLRVQIQEGSIQVPADETAESVIRAKIRETVKDIEYGVVSGVFEFTILNKDFESSYLELKSAAEYCFK